ncbi:MAG TPA: helix-turn-helix domain-containing protein [Puia sp.]|jgi:AraC-like DNA-binding protein|nr:helix-turn-helix domain-containing protein [Puia sp.]
MKAFSGFLETLILLGSLQGFIISVVLFLSKNSRQSNRILAVLIFLMSLASFNLYMTGSTWYSHSPIIIFLSNFIPMIIIMPMGPLIYFYIRSFSDPAFLFKRKYRIHFYPVLIDLVPYLTAVFYVTGLIFKFLPKNDAPWGHFIDQYDVYSDIPRWLSISIYLWIANKYLISNSNATPWLKQFVRMFTVFQVIWLCYLIPYVIPRFSNRLVDFFDWYPVYIPMSVLIYWLGIKGYLVSQAQNENHKSRKSSPLDRQLSEGLVDRLKKVMEEEKLWMDPALNLSILSTHTGIPAKTISAVLNQHLNKSFNEFINSYRIAAIKARLLSSTNKNLTIAGLAYECGFNSQPTFQRAFKNIQGESPSEFLLKNTNSGKQLV